MISAAEARNKSIEFRNKKLAEIERDMKMTIDNKIDNAIRSYGNSSYGNSVIIMYAKMFS